ncbi:TonB-dependent receptor domain-containing protein, partial [Spongiibacter tropicus]
VLNGSDKTVGDAKREQFSQEIKFNGSAWDERLNYTFGLFYAEESLDNALDGTEVGDNGLVAIKPEGAVGIDIPISALAVLPVQANMVNIADYENTTKAAFAQGTLDLAENWQLTLGVRYTEEERASVHVQGTPDYGEYASRLNAQIGSDLAILAPVFHLGDGIYSPVSRAQYLAYDAPEVPLIFGPKLRGDTDFEEWTPSLTLNYLAGDELLESLNLDSLMVYATVSRGFKSGGLDVRTTQTESEIKQFEPEQVLNKEIGFKLDAFDRRLRFNVAAYQMDYTDLQVALYEVGATDTEVVQFTGNAGEAVVDGFELELTALLGPFTINANAGYTDGDFLEYNLGTNTDDGFAIVDRS